MRKMFLFILLILATYLAKSQVFECTGVYGTSTGTPRSLNCSYSSSDYMDFYRHKESWYPNADVPIKTVNIAFIIRQKTDADKQNFDETNSQHNAFLTEIEDRMNYMLSHIEQPSDPVPSVCGTNCYYTDSRIRVKVVQKVFVHNDPFYADGNSTANAVGVGQVLNIFFYGNIQKIINGIPQFETNGQPMYIPGGHSDPYGTGYNWMANQLPSLYSGRSSTDGIAGNIVHEMFHSYGLMHLYQATCCPETCDNNDIDYLADIFGPGPNANCWQTQFCDPVGVAFCTNGFMGSGRYISPMQLGRLHREMMMSRWRTYVCGYGAVPFNVVHNETWDFTIKFYQDVIVTSGVVLTIKCNVEMVPGAKFVVEEGAKLILDGGKITNAESYLCKGLWRGVELWGNSGNSQYSSGGLNYDEPTIEIKNQGEISYAQDAITTWKTGDINTTGGVITCNNAVFRNNRRAVEFMKYQNFLFGSPANKRANLSSFINTQFVQDANLPSNVAPQPFVTAWSVDGIKFSNCKFENNNATATGNPLLGKGIQTIDANFIVTGSSFKELELAINPQQGSSSWNYTVDQCKFINCLGGVYNQGVNKAIITRNEFQLGKPRYSNWFTYGITFDAGTNYRIEENVFNKDASATTYSIGTNMRGTGGDMNQVYKNKFNGINLGNLSNGQNRLANYDPLTGQYKGLQYLCNSHKLLSNYDIAVDGTGPSDGIGNYQGNITGINQRSAGNDFSRMNASGGESDFYNHSPISVVYSYDNSAVTKYPQSVTPGSKVVTLLEPQNACPSNFIKLPGGAVGVIGIGKMTTDVKTKLQSYFISNQTSYNLYRGLYAQLMDGGNTTKLNQDISNASPTDVWALRASLLGKSPYLSNDVLKRVNDKSNVLPNAILYEVLAANPDCFRDEYFVKYISEESKRLPDWMVASLKQITSQNISARAFLESQMAFHKSEMDFVSNVMSDAIIAEDDIDWAAYRSWLGTYQTPWGDYQIIDNYLHTNQLSQATTLINAIPSFYKLSANEQKEYESLKGVISILGAQKNENRTLLQTTPQEKTQLVSIADNGIGTGKVRACNILSFLQGSPYCNFTLQLPVVKSYKTDETLVAEKDILQESSFAVFPIPAKDYFQFSFTLPDGNVEANLQILDITGRIVYEQSLSSNSGQIAINTTEWAQGTYTYSVKTNGKAVATHKLIIAK